MKCDDDTFVNVPNLLHVLLGGTVPLYKAAISFYDTNTVAVKSPKNRLTVGRHLLTGFLFCEAKPIGDTSSKWYVSWCVLRHQVGMSKPLLSNRPRVCVASWSIVAGTHRRTCTTRMCTQTICPARRI